MAILAAALCCVEPAVSAAETGPVQTWIWTRGVDLVAEDYPLLRARARALRESSPAWEEALASDESTPTYRGYAEERCTLPDSSMELGCATWDHEGLPWARVAGNWEPTCEPERLGDPLTPCTVDAGLRIIGHEASTVDGYLDLLFNPQWMHEWQSWEYPGWSGWSSLMRGIYGVDATTTSHLPNGRRCGALPSGSPFDRRDVDCTHHYAYEASFDEYMACLAYIGYSPYVWAWYVAFPPARQAFWPLEVDDFTCWWMDYFTVRFDSSPPAMVFPGFEPTRRSSHQYALAALSSDERALFHYPPDYPRSGDLDLGFELSDQRTIPSEYLAKHYAAAFLGLRTWGQGVLRVLGPVAHYLADAVVPQKAAGMLGAFRSYTEELARELWSRGYPNIVGSSDLCAATAKGTQCIVALAQSYLRRVSSAMSDWTCVPGPECRVDEIRMLERAVTADAEAELPALVDGYEASFQEVVNERCSDTNVMQARASGSGRGYRLECDSIYGGTVPIVHGNPDFDRFFYPWAYWDRRGDDPGPDRWRSDPPSHPLEYARIHTSEGGVAVREAMLRQIDRSVAAAVALLLIIGDPLGGFGSHDEDGDTMPDDIDACPRYQTTLQDTDRDSVFDECDNCPTVGNPGQEDTDRNGSDGLGDACDACPHSNYALAGRTRDEEYLPWAHLDVTHDLDQDGVADACDNCAPRDVTWVGEFPPDDLLRTMHDKFANPWQENCDWRFEVKWRYFGIETLGDACDPEPCTGISPTSADWRPPPGYTDPEPQSEEEVPYPIVPIERGDMRCREHDETGTVCLEADPVLVQVPTTGYRPDPDPLRDHPERLPVMVRRCACWDRRYHRHIGGGRDDCSASYACNTDGATNWDPRYVEGWVAAEVQQRYEGFPTIPSGPLLNEHTVENAVRDWDFSPAEQWTGRMTFSRAGVPVWVAGGSAAKEVDWHWLGEMQPVGWTWDFGYWSLWTRPHIDAPDNGPPLGLDVILTDGRRAATVPEWLLVAKDPDECLATFGHRSWCDDYANAYVRHPVRTAVSSGTPFPMRRGDRISALPPRLIPTGDWPSTSTPASGESDGASGKWDVKPGLRPAVPVIRVVDRSTPWAADDGRFRNYDPLASTQGLLVDWVTVPNGYADGNGYASRMWPGQDAIDVSDFSVLFAGNSTLGDGEQKQPVNVVAPEPAAALTPAADDQWTLPGEDQNAPAGLAGKFYLFGGRRPDGALSSALWMGILDGAGSIDGQVYAQNGGPNEWSTPVEDGRAIVWQELAAEPPGGPGSVVSGADRTDDVADGTAASDDPPPAPRAPPGIAGAVLASGADGKRIFVVGGYNSQGPNTDLWSYNLKRSYWEVWGTPEGFVHLGRDTAATHRAGVVYLYGGWDGQDVLGGLYALDLRTRVLARLDRDGGTGPGPRAAASIQLAAQGGEMVLYGGVTPAGWTDDAWVFNFRTRAWTRLVKPCDGTACPPVGSAGLLYERWSGEVAIVPSGIDATKQPYWILRHGRWIPGSAWSGDVAAGDCNLDGQVDHGYLRACRNNDSWWADAGVNVCATAVGALTCDAPDNSPRTVNTLEQVRGGRLALDEFGAIYAIKHRHVRVFDATDPAHPRQTANVQLAADGRDVLLHEGVLYVATEAGLEAWSRQDRLRPTRLWSVSLPAGADDVVAANQTLIAVEPDGFRVFDVRYVDAPRELAVHQFVRIVPMSWVLDGSAPARDLVRDRTPGRRVAVFDGRLLVIADRADLSAVALDSGGAVVRQYAPSVLSGPSTGLALVPTTLYSSSADTAGGDVLNVLEGMFLRAGRHTLESWVDEARFLEHLAVRPAAGGIEIAYDAP